MNNKVQGILTITIGAVIIIALMTFANTCPIKGHPMKCHWTNMVLRGLGVIIACLGGFKIFIKDAKINIGFNIVEMMLALFALAVIYKLIGTCTHATMPCNIITRPTITFVMIVYFIITIISIIFNVKKIKANN